MRYRIRQHEITTLLIDHPDGEFGRVHPTYRWYGIESMTHPPVDIGKKFRSDAEATKWAKKNKYTIGEHGG